jgi:hypothetical protein
VCQRAHGPSHGPMVPSYDPQPVPRLTESCISSRTITSTKEVAARDSYNAPSHMFSAPTAIPHHQERIDMFLELHKFARHTAHIFSKERLPTSSCLLRINKLYHVGGWFWCNPCTLPAATYLHSLTLIEVYVRCAFQCLDVWCASVL